MYQIITQSAYTALTSSIRCHCCDTIINEGERYICEVWIQDGQSHMNIRHEEMGKCMENQAFAQQAQELKRRASASSSQDTASPTLNL